MVLTDRLRTQNFSPCAYFKRRVVTALSKTSHSISVSHTYFISSLDKGQPCISGKAKVSGFSIAQIQLSYFFQLGADEQNFLGPHLCMES